MGSSRNLGMTCLQVWSAEIWDSNNKGLSVYFLYQTVRYNTMWFWKKETKILHQPDFCPQRPCHVCVAWRIMMTTQIWNTTSRFLVFSLRHGSAVKNNTYRKISNTRRTKSPNLNASRLSSCSYICPIQWSQVLSREWRSCRGSADRRCSNYIWVMDNIIAR